MANLCLAALEELRGFLLASDGINAALAEIAGRDQVELRILMEENVSIQNVPADLADQNVPVFYPALYLFCERMDNRLQEKFTRFSGAIFLVAEVRVSGERFTELGQQLTRYVEATTTVLGEHIGQWTEHLAYVGMFEVRFDEIRLGGRNFLQTARVEIALQGHV